MQITHTREQIISTMSKRAFTSLKIVQSIKRTKHVKYTEENFSKLIANLSKFKGVPFSCMQTRQQQRLKQQSSRGKDKGPERFSSYTIRPNATTKSKRVNPGICTSHGINKKSKSKCAASSSEEMTTAKRSCGHTYNLRSTKHEPGKRDERKRFKHDGTLSGSSGRDASKSLRLKKSLSSRAVSQTFSTPSHEPSVVARKLRSHNIKTRTDPAISCWITGIAITNDGRILVVDRNYGTVKAFYRSMKLQSSLRLYEYIWDITIINNNEAVVGTESGMESKKYFVLDISGNHLQVIRTHPLPFNVYATCRFNDKLIAVTRDSCQAVKMFDMSGKVYWTLSEDHFGHSLYPICVTTKSNDREQSVIVVDQEMNAVLLINGDNGNIKKTVQGIGKSPQGVTIDSDGNVYICLFEDNKIIVLTADLSEQKVLLTKQDRLRGYPQAIAYDKNTHCLLISYMYCDFLDIFEIS